MLMIRTFLIFLSAFLLGCGGIVGSVKMETWYKDNFCPKNPIHSFCGHKLSTPFKVNKKHCLTYGEFRVLSTDVTRRCNHNHGGPGKVRGSKRDYFKNLTKEHLLYCSYTGGRVPKDMVGQKHPKLSNRFERSEYRLKLIYDVLKVEKSLDTSCDSSITYIEQSIN
jgi:hypothetical protein